MKNQNLRWGWAALLFGAASLTTTAHAAGTAAGTEIRNQSTATYLDASGDPQVTTSNEVINIVDEVYGLVITPNQAGANAPLSAAAFTAAEGAIAPGQDKKSAPGNTVYFSLLLENTGNTVDTYDLAVGFDNGSVTDASVILPGDLQIYLDANGNGQVDPGDILLDSLTPAGASGVSIGGTKTPEIAANAIASIIVAVKVPITAVDGSTIYVDLNGTGTGNGATDAVSNMMRVTVVTTDGVLTITKGADVTAASAGQQITYSIQGSNTGGGAVFAAAIGNADANRIDYDASGTFTAADDVEGILIVDDLDDTLLDVGDGYANVTFSAISPATAIALYWNPTLQAYQEAKPTGAIGDARVALFIPDGNPTDGTIGPVLAVGQSFSATFTINIDADNATVSGQNVINSATAIYFPKLAGPAEETESNDVVIALGSDVTTLAPAVVLGPLGFPDGDADDNDLTSAEHPRIGTFGLIADEDTTFAGATSVIAGNAADAKTFLRNAGDVISIPLTIRNDGNTVDTFNLSLAGAVGNDSNAIVRLFKSDGITPLTDTNGDGRPDTGPVAVDGTTIIVARITIPDNAEDDDSDSWTITAASSVRSTVTDPTTIILAGVIPAGVEIATDGTLGDDRNTGVVSNTAADVQDDDVTGLAVAPGSTVIFPVDIANFVPINQSNATEDTQTLKADTYTLAWAGRDNTGASSVIANGFIVNFYEDANGDGVLSTSELLPISDTRPLQAVSDLGTIPANEIFNLGVRVTVPEGTTAGDYYVHVTATSTNNSSKSDTVVLLVRVPAVNSIDILPDNSATVVPGGTVVFKHSVVNNGNAATTVDMTLPTTLPAGWTATFINCADGSVIGATYTTANIPAPAVGVDNTVEVCVRVFVPTNAPLGATIPFDVTATHSDGVTADSAVNVVNVISGNLALTKSVSPTGDVAPGATLTYTTTFQNLGSAPVTEVIIFDAIPAHTTVSVPPLTFVSGTLPNGTTVNAQDNPEYFEYSTNGGLSFTEFDPVNPPSGGSITHLRFDLGGMGVGTGGTVLAGASGSFVFTVTVD